MVSLMIGVIWNGAVPQYMFQLLIRQNGMMILPNFVLLKDYSILYVSVSCGEL